MEDQIDLTMCVDCAHMYANGIDPRDESARAHALAVIAHTPHWTGTVAVGEITDDFSHTPCDVCGTTLAGTRYSGVLFGSMG